MTKRFMGNGLSFKRVSYLFFALLTLTLSCTKEEKERTEKELYEFVFRTADNPGLETDIIATVDVDRKEITATVPFHTDLTALLPTLVISEGATFSPKGIVDFTNSIFYEIQAEDGSAVNYSATVTVAPNTQNQVEAFSFQMTGNDPLSRDITAIIDEAGKTITATVPYGTDLTALLPTLTISEGATYVPHGAQDFSSPMTYTITAEDGSISEYTVSIQVGPSGSKQITSLIFHADDNTSLGLDVGGQIAQEDREITATVPYGTDVTSLLPTLMLSEGAFYSPIGAQDFTNPVAYTVTAEDGSSTVFTILVHIAPNTEKQIMELVFRAEDNTALETDVPALINHNLFLIEAIVPHGTDVTALVPTLTIPDEMTFQPQGERDFTHPQIYQVIAKDGSTAGYTVSVTKAQRSGNKITSMSFEAMKNESLEADIRTTIDQPNKHIAATMPLGTDLTALEPTMNLSEGASFSPQGPQDFTAPVTYTITAEDGTSMDYTVAIAIMKPESRIVSLVFRTQDNPSLDMDLTTSIDHEDETVTAIKRFGTDLGLLVPYLEVSPGATYELIGKDGGTYVANTPIDLNGTIHIKVTAQDGTFREYTLNMEFIAQTEREALIAIYQTNPNHTLDWPLENEDIGSWEGVTLKDGTVVGLNLPSKGLTLLPKAIGILSELTKLTLSRNQLSRIPEEMAHLQKLQRLTLSFNRFTTIGPVIGTLSNLEFLYLNDQPLEYISSDIGQLEKLTYLNLQNDQLFEIPMEIGNLTQLMQFYLDNNPNLSGIPWEVCQLKGIIEEKGGVFVVDKAISCPGEPTKIVR